MKNNNYASEKARAQIFITQHRKDQELMDFLLMLANNKSKMMHSDRWSKIYDWMEIHYPGSNSALITGLVYWVES